MRSSAFATICLFCAAGNVLHGTLAEDPAVLSPNLLHVHAPELVRCQALYPKKGWNDKGELIHNFDPLYPDNNA